MSKPREEWVPAHGSEDTHEVSSLGRIRTWIKGSVNGRQRLSEPRLISTCPNPRSGYLEATFARKKNRTVRVHRLVLLSFYGEPKPGQEGCHINGIKTDNRLENLRWASREDNIADRVKHGRNENFKGARNGMAKLTTEQVLAIRADSRKIFEIAEAYGRSWSTISDIKKGKKWKHV